jgi:hypothetical protein
LSPDQKMIPLCAYNLTGVDGHPLYRPSRTTQVSGGAI